MIQDSTKYTIYILQLENGKYYVGRTKHKEKRLKDHFSNKGCIFTRIFKPEKVLHIFSNCDEYDEDKYLFKVMEIHGIDNVRGGCFSSLKLSENDRSYIEKRILGASDRCYHCKSRFHYIRDCPERTYKQRQLPQQSLLDDSCSSSTVSFLSDVTETTTSTTKSKEEYNFGFVIVHWVRKTFKNIRNLVFNNEKLEKKFS